MLNYQGIKINIIEEFEQDTYLLDTWEIPTRTLENGKYILGDIAKAIEQKLIEKQIPNLDIEGIGMGVPGPIGPDGTVFKCVNLGWGIFNVEQEMKKLTGLKVKAGCQITRLRYVAAKKRMPKAVCISNRNCKNDQKISGGKR